MKLRAMGKERRQALGRRAGLTLLEIVCVLTLIGIFAAVAAPRLGLAPIKNFAAQGDARRLALDLMQARRRAIATGDNHYLDFVTSGGAVTSYTLYRRLSGGGVQAVDSVRNFPQQETVAASHAQAEFNFQGTALAAYQITFTGPDRTWQVNVVMATGSVRVTEQ